MPTLTQIQSAVLAFVLALVIGFGSGYYTKGRFEKADQLAVVVKAQEKSAANVDVALKKSAELDSKIVNSEKNVEKVRVAVATRIAQKVKNETKSNQFVCSWSLDVGDVRLLNAARANAPFSSADVSDGQSQAASGVTAAAFIDNDIQIIKLYHELAERHDALVDWVAEQVSKQRTVN